MGVLNDLSRVLFRSDPARSKSGVQTARAPRRLRSGSDLPPAPEKPIEVRIFDALEDFAPDGDEPRPEQATAQTPQADSPAHDDGDAPIADETIFGTDEELAASADGALDAVRRPRNKRELIDELRRNYDEVLGLVRKVDGHLDAERARGDRLLEIAEAVRPAIEMLPELRRQNERIAEAIEALADASRRSGEQDAEERRALAERQEAAIDRVRAAVAETESAHARVADAIGGFGGVVESIAQSNERLGSIVIDTQQSSDRRERELADAVISAQKWIVTAVSLCGAVVVLALVTTLLAVFG